ncbi:hypothetical protein B0H19DRAFT_1300578, partial [Mycena capillaripes]
WVFVALLVGVGNAVQGELYEALTPYWCWIRGCYLGLSIGREHVWFWVTLAVSPCLYLTLFLWARGKILGMKSDGEPARSTARPTNAYGNARPTPRRVACTMIAYPACYCVLVLLLSVVRWLAFTHGSVGIPNAATLGSSPCTGLAA